MKHARADYDVIQDITAARQLAELVLGMGMVTDKGCAARQLARQVLGIENGTAPIIPMDEPVFLVRGQDAVGGEVVRAWANLAEAVGAHQDITTIAREHATKMDTWPKKKVPDLPHSEDRP